MVSASLSSKAGLIKRSKRIIQGVGLKPLALSLLRGYQASRGWLRNRYRIEIDGVEVVFATEDQHSKRFFHHRYRAGQWHEPPVTRQIVSHLQGTKVFADVGAHLGYFGCVAGALDRDRQVFLFEMNHNLVPLIERNLAANALTKTEVVNHPVSDRRKMVRYDHDSTDWGLSMQSGDSAVNSKLGQIETISLDEFFLEKGVMPDVIKMDVQGAEMEALQGAKDLISNHHPVLFLEVHPTMIGDLGAAVRDVYDFLVTHHGYTLQRINEHRGAENGKLIDVHAVDELPETTHTLLCTHAVKPS